MTHHVGKAGMLSEMFMEASNRHDVSKVSELLADNVTYWEPTLPAPINGREAVSMHLKDGWKVFPDSNLKLLNRVESGDWVVDEVEWAGTQKGPIDMPGQMPIPATNKRAMGRAVSVAKVSGGKITSVNVYYDNMGMLAQLGLMGAPGSR